MRSTLWSAGNYLFKVYETLDEIPKVELKYKGSTFVKLENDALIVLDSKGNKLFYAKYEVGTGAEKR